MLFIPLRPQQFAHHWSQSCADHVSCIYKILILFTMVSISGIGTGKFRTAEYVFSEFIIPVIPS
jgi:hypothetical protein